MNAINCIFSMSVLNIRLEERKIFLRMKTQNVAERFYTTLIKKRTGTNSKGSDIEKAPFEKRMPLDVYPFHLAS